MISRFLSRLQILFHQLNHNINVLEAILEQITAELAGDSCNDCLNMFFKDRLGCVCNKTKKQHRRAYRESARIVANNP